MLEVSIFSSQLIQYLYYSGILISLIQSYNFYALLLFSLMSKWLITGKLSVEGEYVRFIFLFYELLFFLTAVELERLGLPSLTVKCKNLFLVDFLFFISDV